MMRFFAYSCTFLVGAVFALNPLAAQRLSLIDFDARLSNVEALESQVVALESIVADLQLQLSNQAQIMSDLQFRSRKCSSIGKSDFPDQTNEVFVSNAPQSVDVDVQLRTLDFNKCQEGSVLRITYTDNFGGRFSMSGNSSFPNAFWFVKLDGEEVGRTLWQGEIGSTALSTFPGSITSLVRDVPAGPHTITVAFRALRDNMDVITGGGNSNWEIKVEELELQLESGK